MAFWFTHALVAFETLKKLRKKDEFSSPELIDDYLFGSIAPDIKYFMGINRKVTHLPLGKNSAFEAFKGKTSGAFIAGYEGHLICDTVWEGNCPDIKSSYNFFKVDPNKPAEKFALYFFIDDYFQGQSDWFLPTLFSGNILMANETRALKLLGANDLQIAAFKAAATLFLKEPGANFLQALGAMRMPLEEKVISELIKSFTPADDYLGRFFDIAIARSVESIENHM